MTQIDLTQIPTLVRPPFPQTGRFYMASVAAGFNPATLTRDTADSVVRHMTKAPNASINTDIHYLWKINGDGWSELIKDVKNYTTKVNKFLRDHAKAEKAREREVVKIALADAKLVARNAKVAEKP